MTSPAALYALVAFVVTALVLAVLVSWRRRRRSRRLPSSPRAPGGPWDGELAARRLVDRSRELKGVYRRLGFSVELERQMEALLEEMVELVHCEIPDVRELRAALEEARRQLDATDDPSSPLAAARRERHGSPLLRDLLALGEDEGALRERLDRDPVHEPVPFVEEVPVLFERQVKWRNPMEVKVLRKRPRDAQRFRFTLREVERRVRQARLPRPDRAERGVLTAVTAVERSLEHPDAYLPAALRRLEEASAKWLVGAAPEPQRSRRDRLETLLRGLVEARRGYGSGDLRPGEAGEWIQPPRREADALREAVLHQAQDYSRTPWMQAPLLTALLLANLVHSEIGRLPASGAGAKATAAAEQILVLVRDEATSGYFDPEETSSRLRRLEADGIFVSSLAYGLLRLPAESPAPERLPMPSQVL